MKFNKKLLVLPLTLTFGLSALTSCDILNQNNTAPQTPQENVGDNNTNQDTPQTPQENNGDNNGGNTEIKPDKPTEQGGQNESDKPQTEVSPDKNEQGGQTEEGTQAVIKKMSLKNINEFNDNFIKEEVARDNNVAVSNVSIENPTWKTNITVDKETNKKMVEVSLTVMQDDGTKKTYICLIDLSAISDDLEVVINGPSNLVVGSLEKMTADKILEKFIITDKKGRDLDATVVIQNSADLNLEKAGIYNILISATENTTKVRAFKNVTIEVKQQYLVKYVVNGAVVQTDIVEAGKGTMYRGETPTKARTEEFTYNFTGWNSEEGKPIYKDMTFVANFEETRVAYKVEFYRPDGKTPLFDTAYVPVGEPLSTLKIEPDANLRFSGLFTDKEMQTPLDDTLIPNENLVLYGEYYNEIDVKFTVKGLGEDVISTEKVLIGTNLSELIKKFEQTKPEIAYFTLKEKNIDGTILTADEQIKANCSEIVLTYEANTYTKNINFKNFYSVSGKTKDVEKKPEHTISFTYLNYKEVLNNAIALENVDNTKVIIKTNETNSFESSDTITFEDLNALDNANEFTITIFVKELQIEYYDFDNTPCCIKANKGMTYKEAISYSKGYHNPYINQSYQKQDDFHYYEFDINFGRYWLGWLSVRVRMYIAENPHIDDTRDFTIETGSRHNVYRIVTPDKSQTFHAGQIVTGDMFYEIRNTQISKSQMSYGREANSKTNDIEFVGFRYETNHVSFPIIGNSSDLRLVNLYEPIHSDKKFTPVYRYITNIHVFKEEQMKSNVNISITALPVKIVSFYVTNKYDKFTYRDFRFVSFKEEKQNVSGFNGQKVEKIMTSHSANLSANSSKQVPIKSVLAGYIYEDYSNVSFDVEAVSRTTGKRTTITKKYGEKVTINEIKQLSNLDTKLYEIKVTDNYDVPYADYHTFSSCATVYYEAKKIKSYVNVSFKDSITNEIFKTDKLTCDVGKKIYDEVMNKYITVLPNNASYDYEIVRVYYGGSLLTANNSNLVHENENLIENVELVVKRIPKTTFKVDIMCPNIATKSLTKTLPNDTNLKVAIEEILKEQKADSPNARVAYILVNGLNKISLEEANKVVVKSVASIEIHLEFVDTGSGGGTTAGPNV